MKTQIVIIPQWFLDQYRENFPPQVITNLLRELNTKRPVVGENHINLKLGVVECAFHQPGVGIVVQADIVMENASTQLRSQLNDFYTNPNRSIFASLTGLFKTSPQQKGVSNVIDLFRRQPNTRITGIDPVEVSLLSRDYDPAIAGSMLRHNRGADVDGILTLDFDLNNGGVKKNNMSEGETKKEESKPQSAEVVDEKEFNEYVSVIEERGFKQGLVVGQTRSMLEDGLKKHEIDLDDEDKKMYEDFMKVDKRHSDDTMKVVNNLKYTISVLDKKAAKKVEPPKEAEKETSKKEEGNTKEKSIPPRPVDPPNKDISKGKKEIPASWAQRIKTLGDKIKKESA